MTTNRMTTCYRLVGEEGENCRTCGRRIVRRNLTSGAYALEHEGPSIAQRLHELNKERER